MRKLKLLSISLCIFVFITGVLVGCDTRVKPPVRNTKLVKIKEDVVNSWKFDPPVTVTTIRYYGPQVKFQEGESINNNIWTRAYQKYCGINLSSVLSVTNFSVFDTKVTALISTNDLPDIIPVYTTLFFRMANVGKLQDLSPYYKEHASKEVKYEMEKKAGGLAKVTCTYDDKLLALAGAPSLNSDMFWIREDWLQNLGLEKPKTMSEVLNVVKAFAKNDPDQDPDNETFGMPLDNTLGTLNGVGAAYHVYRNIWVEDEETGELFRGDVDENWKPVLQMMNDLYDDGIINPEFISFNSDNMKYEYADQKLGIAFGPGYLPDGTLNYAIEANSKARWVNYPVPSNDDKPALTPTSTRVSNFYAANKDSLYPEAIILIANIFPQLSLGIGKKYQEYHDFQDEKGDRYDSFFYPVISLGMPENAGTINSNAVMKAFNSNDPKDFEKMTGEQLGYYERMKPWVESQNPEGWRMYGIFGTNGAVSTDDYMVENKLYYPDRFWDRETDTWVKNGPALSGKATEMFDLMIQGTHTVDEGWQLWMDAWKNDGGEKCTAEVNEWWKNKGKAGFKNVSKK